MRRAVLLVALVPAARADFQEAQEPRPPLEEGALSNDVFLPVSDPAVTALSAGDSALARARAARDEGRAEEAERLLAEALDGWHRAIELAEPGSSVWFEPSKDGPRRLSEGARFALVRRLSELSPAERAVWTERFDPGRERLLEATGRAEELAKLERTALGTTSAARAALLQCDAALEAGDRSSATGHLARAALHAELARTGELRDALERRRAHLESKRSASAAAAWETAKSLTLTGQASLAGPVETGLRSASSRPRDRTGIAFLSERRIAVQTAELVHLVELGPEGTLEPRTAFRPADLLGGLAPAPVRDATPRPLVPVAGQGHLVLVHGVSSGDEPNALLCLEPPGELGPRAFLEDRLAPELAWAIVGGQRLEPSGEVREVPELAELSALEFQPGPLIVGERVIVQAREYPGDVRAWLIALGLRTGEVLWERRIASGADLRPERRFDTDRRLWAQPLLLLDEEGAPRVFAGTNLGAGALFDSLDGEPCWTLKNRRRDPLEDGWLGARPARATDAAALLWTPNDSDRLYTLGVEPVRAGDRETGSLFLAPPSPRAHAERCLGGDLREVLVLGTREGVRAVSTRRAGLDPIMAVHLSSIESFAGDGLVSKERVLVPSDRKLYLFDRGRELYLLDLERLPSLGRSADPIQGAARGIDLVGRGRLVLAVGDEALWAFRAD